MELIFIKIKYLARVLATETDGSTESPLTKAPYYLTESLTFWYNLFRHESCFFSNISLCLATNLLQWYLQ